MLHSAVVFIVEDEQDIREALKTLFELEGYRVQTAVNGSDAILKLDCLSNSVVLLVDLMMPIMNGWEFIEAVRKKYTKADVPIIVMSAAADRASSIRDQVNAIIRKPIEVDDILNLVDRECIRMKAVV